MWPPVTPPIPYPVPLFVTVHWAMLLLMAPRSFPPRDEFRCARSYAPPVYEYLELRSSVPIPLCPNDVNLFDVKGTRTAPRGLSFKHLLRYWITIIGCNEHNLFSWIVTWLVRLNRLLTFLDLHSKIINQHVLVLELQFFALLITKY